MNIRRFNPTPSPCSGPVVEFDHNGRQGRGRVERFYRTGVLVQSFDGTETVFAPDGFWWYSKTPPLPNRRLPPPTGRIPRLPG